MYNDDIATMTVTEFRAFRKALVVLYRAGIGHNDAVSLLVNAQQTKRHRDEQNRISRIG